jgi:hypothetical protein
MDDSCKLPEFFDPSQEEGSSANLLPVGIYLAQIIEAAVTVPQSQDGYGINLNWEVTAGDCEGRRIRQRITFQHSSNAAQTFGRREFKDLCDACGITKGFNSVEPLKFIRCKIRIGIEKDKNGIYDDKNKVTRVWPASKGPPLTQQQSGSPVSAPRPSSPTASSASPKSSPAKTSVEAMMAGARFTDQWQPNSGTSPQASSSSQASATQTAPQASSPNGGGVPPQATTAAANGGGDASPQASSQAPVQNSPPQTSSSQVSPHGDMPPWRDQS